MIRAAIACTAFLLLASCDEGPREGPPIRIEVDPGLARDGPISGVFEVREGPCSDLTVGGPLHLRHAFPEMSSDAPETEPFPLDRGVTYCFRVFAISDDHHSPTQECTVRSLGEQTVEAGAPLAVTIEVPSQSSSALSRLNEMYGAALCPPSPRAPFDGEHLGSHLAEACSGGRSCARTPTFRFGANEGADVYCLEVSSGETDTIEHAVISGVTTPMVEHVWSGTALGESAASYTWRVRSCVPACPDCGPAVCPTDRTARYSGDAQHCTAWSRPRRFVARPWGNINDDAFSDFVFGGLLENKVYVFRSVAAAGDETYDLCGTPYEVSRLGLPSGRPLCNSVTHPMIGVPNRFFGSGTALADVGGDHRSELIATAVNCFEPTLAIGSPTGGMFFYGADQLTVGGEPRPIAMHYFRMPADAAAYGLSLRTTRRTQPAGAAVTALAAELPGFTAARSGVLELSGTDVAVVDVTVPSFTGHVVGRGDLSGDGREDLLFREGALLAPPDPTAFVAPPPGFELVSNSFASGGRLQIVADSDANGRAEILEFGVIDPDSCRQPVRRWELQPATATTEATFREIASTYDRALVPFAEISCDGGSLNPVCASLGGSCATGTTCERCVTQPLAEQQFGIDLPHGTAYTSEDGDDRPRARVALMGNLGVVLTTPDFAVDESIPRSGLTRCGGVVMRAYDFDGDGHDDILMLDPGGDFMRVICGDSAPSIDVVANTLAGAFRPDSALTTPPTCQDLNAIWSLSP